MGSSKSDPRVILGYCKCWEMDDMKEKASKLRERGNAEFRVQWLKQAEFTNYKSDGDGFKSHLLEGGSIFFKR